MKNKFDRMWRLVVLCIASSVIYELVYLSFSYYDVMIETFGITNAQMGMLMSVFGSVAMICYFPGGWIADRFSAKYLMVISMVSTGILGIWEMTIPSYSVLLVIYFLWGISLSLTFWAALLKATRQLGDRDEQGRMYGVLEAGRGLLPMLYGTVIVILFRSAGNDAEGLKRVILSYSLLNFLGAAAVMLFMKKYEDTLEQKKAPVLKDIIDLMKRPKIWLVAGIVFVSYCMYTSFSYITPYLTELYGVDRAEAASLALIRTYGIAVFGGAFSGFLADKIGSRIRMLIYSFTVGAVGVIAFLVTKTSTGSTMLVIGAMIVTGLGIFMTRGIYFAVLDEINIEARIGGLAIGLVSFIGFMPETFIYSLIGNWLDRYDGTKPYKMIFILMLICALTGIIFSALLGKSTKKKHYTSTL